MRDPIGNVRAILVSDQAGRSILLSELARLGIEADPVQILSKCLKRTTKYYVTCRPSRGDEGSDRWIVAGLDVALPGLPELMPRPYFCGILRGDADGAGPLPP
jgi:hypothetical protein